MNRHDMPLPIIAKLYPNQKGQNPGTELIQLAEKRMKAGQTGQTFSCTGEENTQIRGGIHMVETKEDEGLRIYNTRGNEPVCFKDWWEAEPNMGRVADGVAARLDRLKAIGNGQVPAVMATAWCVLLRRFLEKNPE